MIAALKRLRRSVAPVLATGVLAGCAGAIPLGGESGGSRLALGDNLVGEACRAEPVAGDAALAAAGLQGQSYDIFCGAWEQPSARLLRVPESDAGISSLLASGAWRGRLDLKAACEAPVTSQIAGGLEARLFDCRLRNGGWPYVAFGAVIGGKAYLADGIPAAQPVMEAAAAMLSGGAAAKGTSGPVRSKAVERLEARLEGRLFGTGELRDYQLLLKTGSYYNGIKNFPEAEKRYREAVEIHQRVLGAQDPEFGDPLMHLAVEISNQERFKVADALFAEAGPLVRRAADPADYARYISYLALHEANRRDYEVALKYARQATALRKEIAAQAGGFGDLQGEGRAASQAGARLASGSIVLQTPANVAAIDVAQSLGIEAAMLNLTARPQEALRSANEAMAVVEASVASPEFWRPQVLELAARINGNLDRNDEAERQIITALRQRELIAKDSRPLALAHLELANIHLAQGKTGKARDAFRAGLGIVKARGGSLRFFQVEPYLNLLWNTAQKEPDRQAALSVEMFDAAQLVRGAVAAQNISEAAARLSSSDRAVGAVIRELQDARRRRDALLFRFSALAARSRTAEDSLGLERIRQQIAAEEARIAELEPQAQAAAPGLNILRDKASGLAQLAPLLRPDEALAQILVGEVNSFVFLVRGGQVHAQRVEVSREIVAQAVNRLREAFVVRRTAAGASVGGFDVRLAFALYGRLLGPLSARLEGVSHLITVPSGPLLSLPLGLLVTEPPPEIENSNYSEVAWLLKKTAVSLSPSVRSFTDLRGKAKASQAAKPFLGLGDFVPQGDAEVILASRQLPEGCRAGAEAVASAPRLPETAGQVQAMAASFGVGAESTVLGQDFNEETLASLPLDQYRVLVFATHGLLPGQLDCLSEPSLVVSRPPTSGPEADGLLTYSEIFDLTLDADVVVLSACNTGGPLSQSGQLGGNFTLSSQAPEPLVDRGEADRVRGESLAGLARAFFYAGARSLLVSNWEVYTDATVGLMTRTFSGFQDGVDTTLAGALRQAKLSFATDAANSHPYLWGSFTLVGDGALDRAIKQRPAVPLDEQNDQILR